MSFAVWRSSLRPASLRGVAFEVDSVTLKGGRRNVQHEYPQRDRGYVEDLGRKMRTFPIVAFVLGDDWREKRDALIAACEAGGPARLVHPTYGVLTVAVDEFEVEESSDHGRLSRISISVIESGALEFPTGLSSTSADLLAKADAAGAATASAFVAGFTTAGLPSFAATAALTSLAARIAVVRRAIARVGAEAIAEPAALAAAVLELEVQSAALIAAPSQLAAQFANVFGTIGVLKLLDALTADAGNVTAAAGGTPTARAIAFNGAALYHLQIRSGLVASARLVAATTFASYDEAIAARNGLADKLAAEAEGADDDTFAALTDLRLALVADVELRAAELVRLRTLALPAATSTLELAQLLYGDGTRCTEIEARNDFAHPGFIAGAAVVAET